MALKALKCPNCDANIQVDDNRDYGFCSYCGSQIQVKEVVEIWRSENEEMKPDLQFEQMIENGNAHLKMKDYYKAEIHFWEVIREYPGRAQGYERLICVITREYTTFLIENQERVNRLLDKMTAVVKENEREHYEELRRKIEESFRTGAVQQNYRETSYEIERFSKMIRENVVIAVGLFLFAFGIQSAAVKSFAVSVFGLFLCILAIVFSLLAIWAKMKRDELMAIKDQMEEGSQEER